MSEAIFSRVVRENAPSGVTLKFSDDPLTLRPGEKAKIIALPRDPQQTEVVSISFFKGERSVLRRVTGGAVVMIYRLLDVEKGRVRALDRIVVRSWAVRERHFYAVPLRELLENWFYAPWWA